MQMNFIKSLNRPKRKLLKFFTNSISDYKKYNDLDPLSVKKVLICRPNHRLGNLLLISPLIQEIENTFPNCKIDLLTNQSCARQLYVNYNTVDRIYELPKKPFKNLFKYLKVCFSFRTRKYDLSINAVGGSSSGRIFTVISRADFKLVDSSKWIPIADGIASKHIAKESVFALRQFLQTVGISDLESEISPLAIKLTKQELINGKKNVRDLVNNDQQTICLFTYATGAKCYSEQWWEIFYNELKNRFPKVNIIEVLPKENISKIGYKEPTFYTRNIRELAGVIANTDIFLGADSGIMHLASATHTTTLGLFSVTNIDMYKPFDNGSLPINTNTVRVREIMKLIESRLFVELEEMAI